MLLPHDLPSVSAIESGKNVIETRLEGLDKLRFYLRFFSLFFCTIASGFIYYCLKCFGKNDTFLIETGYSIGIIKGHHYFYLVLGVFSVVYCFLAMFQTLAQGHQYNLPKWLIFSYITIDFILIVGFLVATNLVLVGSPAGPIGVNESDKFSGYLTLRLVACKLSSSYSYDWKEKHPESIDFPSICTFSTVSGVLGYFIFVLSTLSLCLTFYLRYQWKNVRSRY
ncbi:hypothetical protein K502DRAFT_348156 [Neoconidiobolus thromboides FSU 785]|nr:hypothetical protein K502DRAFT_348156 [Neoconidiobolus thromboides FSU 785]